MEFALVLPLVLLLVLALLQVGLLVKDQVVLESSARAGVREAAVTTDDGAVRDAAVAAAVGLDPDRLTVTIDREGGGGTPASVAVGYDAPIAVSFVAWLFPDSIPLSAEAVMRQEVG